MIRLLSACTLAAFTLLSATAVRAQVVADDAWTRSTVPGQRTAAIYLRLRSAVTTSVVGIASPLAASGEVHRMVVEGSTMKMRTLSGLELPAGKVVELKPGGLHLMLLDLKRPLAEGESVPVVLTVRDGEGRNSSIEVKAKVRALGSRDTGSDAPSHEH